MADNNSSSDGLMPGMAAGGAKIGIEAAVGGAGKVAAQEFLEEAAKFAAARAYPLPTLFPGSLPLLNPVIPGFRYALPALSNIGAHTAAEFLATSAAGAVLIETACIVGDFSSAVYGTISYEEARNRIPARLGNMALNATGQSVGSAVGMMLMPGYGYFLGGFVGSVAAGLCNWSTVRPADPPH